MNNTHCLTCGSMPKDIKYHWAAPQQWNGGAWSHYVQRKNESAIPNRFAQLLANAHIRCIHLPKRIDREMIMLEAFRRLGISERKNLFFHAIDGNKPPLPNPGLRPGNWGCALSKSAVMQEAAQKKPLLLLEDDVVISPQIHSIMDACLAELPKDWKVLYLGCVALDPHETMPTDGQPKRKQVGKWYEILANPNLNHAILIRDVECLKELSEILADPQTYKRDEGRYTSDYTVAQYFAYKGIPMYGVVPAVAKQCGTYSDNENKVIDRKADFKKLPGNVLQQPWALYGATKFPVEWEIEKRLPKQLQNKGYTAAKIHPPFNLTLILHAKSDIAFTLLDTSRVNNGETIQIEIASAMPDNERLPAVSKTTIILPGTNGMPLDPGEYKITCQPDGETWRWKHAAICVKEIP